MPYKTAAEFQMLRGPFNVNSTSVLAWKAVLASMNRSEIATLWPRTAQLEMKRAGGVAISSMSLLNGGANRTQMVDPVKIDDVDSNDWNGYRELTEPELENKCLRRHDPDPCARHRLCGQQSLRAALQCSRIPLVVGQRNLRLMIESFRLLVLTVIGLSTMIHAQQKEPVPVRFRAVLHDPVRPTAELFYPDKTGVVVKLNFRPQDLTEALFTVLVNGSLMLYDKATIDLKNPAASLAASVILPPNLKRAIVIVIPAPAGTKPAYQLLVIDDSAKAFPAGESRVIPMVSVETAIQAGEHRVPVPPGKITTIPPVMKRNEYKMAQTNFYHKQGDSWVPFTERQLQFLDAYRRIFIVHVTPGALQPKVTTIVDTMPMVSR
jgi:hypothetical protein